MAGDLAILAGAGSLPVMLARAWPQARRITFQGVAHDLGPETDVHRIERLGGLVASLRRQGVRRLVMAGAMSRPAMDPGAFDDFMQSAAPRLAEALQGGDDTLLRLVIALFEEQGFAVLGAHELLDGLTAAPGVLVGDAPGAEAMRDARRGFDILAALSPLDVGQAAVVEGGLCLGIETQQGTDFLLQGVARTPQHLRRGDGVLVKAAKRGQDLRVDMPAIGPGTAVSLERAGLAGAVIEAGRVMILDRPATLDAFRRAGLFLLAQVP